MCPRSPVAGQHQPDVSGQVTGEEGNRVENFDVGDEVEVVDEAGKPNGRPVGRLRGSIPRSFLDRFEAPPDEEDRNLDRAYLLEWHRQLGKFYELAMTFTMIAGLLNILVILDAVEGPAYGFGDTDTKEAQRQNATAAGTGVEKPAPAGVAAATNPSVTK